MGEPQPRSPCRLGALWGRSKERHIHEQHGGRKATISGEDFKGTERMAVITNTSVHLPVSAIVSVLSLVLCGYLSLTSEKQRMKQAFNRKSLVPG